MSKTETIYLDYNSTAPLRDDVAAIMCEVAKLPLNPSSVHYYGRQAKKYVEDARFAIADLMAVWPDEVIFTASATEANNMALNGLKGYNLLVASTEHSSVMNVARECTASKIIPVDNSGILRLDILDQYLRASGEKSIVSVMLANNETGVIQPIKEIADMVHKYGAIMHCDAVQAFGKLVFEFGVLGVDMLTISAHKLGGPVGVGALLLRNDLRIEPLLRGGGQERRMRAGTENVAAIAGFGCLAKNMPDLSHLVKWRDFIEQQIKSVSPKSIIAGVDVERVVNTINITMPGVGNETQLMHFDLQNICVSAGSACSAGRLMPSHVLEAMGFSSEDAANAIRISMGWNTRQSDIDNFVQEWLSLYNRLSVEAVA